MSAVPADVLDPPVITPRPLADYRNMFLLTDEELLAGPILDCPGGASPFGAQVRARGGTVVSVDPAYARTREDLAVQITADRDRLLPWIKTNFDNVDWSYVGSPDALMRSFELATDFFLADYANDGERYLTATLPSLPFPDKHFHLTLTSHLLFCYAHILTFDQHLASLLELVRVTNGEVRAFPLVDSATEPYPRLDELRAELADHGVHTEVRQADYAYEPGMDKMLACRANT